jgi:hypothetical protein
MSRLLLIACALLGAMPVAASAQTRRPPARPPAGPRVEVGIGAGIAGGLTLGERDATLRANGVTAAPFRLFSSSTRLAPAPVLDVRLGYRVTPRLMVEGTLSVGRPELTSTLSGDAESAATVEATTRLTEYVITGGGVWRLSTNPRRRWTPFVSGGGGVARHVYDGRALIESGVDGYAGGGLLYALTRRTGLRLDGRVHVLSGGVAEGQGVSPRGALSGGIFVTF